MDVLQRLCATSCQVAAVLGALQLFSSYDGICAPILCKMEAASVASCQVYEDEDGVIGPGSRVIHGDYSTDVGVRWDAANTTALIAFRGSQVTPATSLLHCQLALLLSAPHNAIVCSTQSVSGSCFPLFSVVCVLFSFQSCMCCWRFSCLGVSRSAAVVIVLVIDFLLLLSLPLVFLSSVMCFMPFWRSFGQQVCFECHCRASRTGSRTSSSS